MTNTGAKAVTKKDMLVVARAARKYGHYQDRPGSLEVYVNCPQCKEKVIGYLEIDLTTFKRFTPTRALDKAMMLHLPFCGEE
ncbi:MAG: hypothetical protein IPK85_03000 [Gemmatimonadetes bacterium]|nr:hypothetical protein [Gemmatimonadota bacterium]